MEKNTRSLSTFSEKHNTFAVTVIRSFVTALLVSCVILVAMSGPVRSEAAAQLGYTPASFNAGTNPSAAKIGDLDGDGRNDIAVVNRQGDLQLFFNNGAGSFQRVSLNGLWSSSANTRDVDIGDLNSDGRNDLAVAFSTQTGALSILLNQGGRSFAAPVNYNSCNSSNGVAIGDLDRDGDNDLADISQCNRSSILLNNGHGSFALSGAYGGGGGSSSIALADLNRDGAKDVVYLNDSSVTILMNNGNATFSAPKAYWVWDMGSDLAVGDFDGDGHSDIAVVNSYYSLVFILINGGDGDMISYSELPSYGIDAPTGIVVGDFNGDGRPLDFALISTGTNSLTVFLNQGYYIYGHSNAISVGQSPVDLAAGNLDGDSLPDLVTVNQGGGSITVLFSAVAAPPPPPPPPPPPAQITLTVSTSKTKTARLVELRWSGSPSSNVDIYRNGSRRATVSNTGRYTDQFSRNANGTYRYKVCLAGGQQCSSETTISF